MLYIDIAAATTVHHSFICFVQKPTAALPLPSFAQASVFLVPPLAELGCVGSLWPGQKLSHLAHRVS